MEDIMFRHPRYREIPWAAHWDQKESGSQHHLLLMLILILMAMFLIGVGVTSGLM
jgi:hypothetical protein